MTSSRRATRPTPRCRRPTSRCGGARHGQPGGQVHAGQPDLRHADHPCRRGREHHLLEAFNASGVCRHRQRTAVQLQDDDALLGATPRTPCSCRAVADARGPPGATMVPEGRGGAPRKHVATALPWGGASEQAGPNCNERTSVGEGERAGQRAARRRHFGPAVGLRARRPGAVPGCSGRCRGNPGVTSHRGGPTRPHHAGRRLGAGAGGQQTELLGAKVVNLAPATVPLVAAPAALVGPLLDNRENLACSLLTLAQSSTFELSGLSTIAYFVSNPDGTLEESGPGWNGFESQDLANLITRAHAHRRVGWSDRPTISARARRRATSSPTSGHPGRRWCRSSRPRTSMG